MNKIYNLKGILAAGLGLLLAGCHEPPPPQPISELPAARVTVLEVTSSNSIISESIPGTVVPQTRTMIESKITGRILEMNAEPGQQVEAGEVLIRIQAPEITAQVDQTEAALELAQQNEARIRNLLNRQAATRAEMDAATSQLLQAKAMVREAKSMQAYATVPAPFDGVVSKKVSDEGDLATPGRMLLEIEVPTGRQFEAHLPESLIALVKVGDRHQIEFSEASGKVTGELAEINPAGAPASRTWSVKYDLPDEPQMRSGAYGRVSIPSGKGGAITIPSSAVNVRGQLEQVFVAVDGRAVLRLIKTGNRDGDALEVISGLSEGDRLITDRPVDLQDGQAIEL